MEIRPTAYPDQQMLNTLFTAGGSVTGTVLWLKTNFMPLTQFFTDPDKVAQFCIYASLSAGVGYASKLVLDLVVWGFKTLWKKITE